MVHTAVPATNTRSALPGQASKDVGEATLAQLHRTRAADAWPVRWAEAARDRFTVVARWPHDHPFFEPTPAGGFDPLLVAETFRQAGLLITHAAYGVPVGHSFLMNTMRYACLPEHLTAPRHPVEVEVDVHCVELNRRGGLTSPRQLDLAVRTEGRIAATGTIDVQVATPAVYRRLRGDRAVPGFSSPVTPPIAAARAGRSRLGDVLLSATPQEQVWQLRVDTSHPTLFQSPKDHVPGMLLLEAARQAAHAIAAPTAFAPFAADVSFHSYAEFGAPCWIQALAVHDPGAGAGTIRVTGHQEDRLVFLATLRDTAAQPARLPRNAPTAAPLAR